MMQNQYSPNRRTPGRFAWLRENIGWLAGGVALAYAVAVSALGIFVR